jgi:hypothetical protein
MEREFRLIEMIVPEMTDLDQVRTEAEWSVRLEHLRARLAHLVPMVILEEKHYENSTSAEIDARRKEVLGPDTATFLQQTLGHARDYLRSRGDLSKEQVERMPAPQAVVLFLVGTYQKTRDEWFKTGYLGYPEARPLFKSKPASPEDKAARLLTGLPPSVQSVHTAQTRLESRIAGLRVIEALRLYAAQHGGTLPEALDRVTEVPVPLDPGTGQPFGYRRDGAVAVLSASPGDTTVWWPTYRITIRPADGPKK